MFNINNDSAVRLETYLDDNATNHWKKVADVVDNGGSMRTIQTTYFTAQLWKIQRLYSTNAGPIATFRSDNMIWDFKDLNIREIQPPSDVKVDTIKQITTNTSSTYNPYVFGNATQEWLDKEHNVKILFSSFTRISFCRKSYTTKFQRTRFENRYSPKERNCNCYSNK